MTFTAPLGLLALLAIPAIVAIHLFRRVPNVLKNLAKLVVAIRLKG